MRGIWVWLRLFSCVALCAVACASPASPVPPETPYSPTMVAQILPSAAPASQAPGVWSEVESALPQAMGAYALYPWDWIGFYDGLETQLANSAGQGLIRLEDFTDWPDEGFRLLLKALDPDGDGWADLRLLGWRLGGLATLEGVFMPPELAVHYDANEDGLMGREEALAFFRATAEGREALTVQDLLAHPWADREAIFQVFAAYDPDGDYAISLGELERGVIGLVGEYTDEEYACPGSVQYPAEGEEFLCQEIASWDVDDDGMLEVSDFELPLVEAEGLQTLCPAPLADGVSPCTVFDSTVDLAAVAALVRSGLRPTWTWAEPEPVARNSGRDNQPVVWRKSEVRLSYEEELAALARHLSALRAEAQSYMARANYHRGLEDAKREVLQKRLIYLQLAKKLEVYGDALLIVSGITAMAAASASVGAQSGLRVTLGLGKNATIKSVYSGITSFFGKKASRDAALRAVRLGVRRGQRVAAAEFQRLAAQRARQSFLGQYAKELAGAVRLTISAMSDQDEETLRLASEYMEERGWRRAYELLEDKTNAEWRATREELRLKLDDYLIHKPIVTGLWRTAPGLFFSGGQVYLWQIGNRIEGAFEYTYDRVLVGTVWINKKKSGRIAGEITAEGMLRVRWWEGTRGYENAKPGARGEARWELVRDQPNLLRGEWKRESDDGWQGPWDMRRER